MEQSKIENTLAREERNQGIDFLRILCMMMVCLLHTLGEFCVSLDTPQLLLTRFLQVMCVCCVNGYAMISGYVGLTSSHRIRTILKLWLTVVFYCVICWLLLSEDKSLQTGVKMLLPVLSIQYWYFSAYFLLFFFIPMVSAYVQNATAVQLTATAAAVAMVSVGATVLPAFRDLWSVGTGFTIFWLLLMTFLGALFRRFPIGRRQFWIPVYGVCIAVSFGYQVLQEYLGKTGGVLVMDYVFPLSVLEAIALLRIFAEYKPRKYMQKIIQMVAPATFGIYILHYNKNVWEWLSRNIHLQGSTALVWALLLAAGMFTACLVIDRMRAKLFQWLKVDQFSIWCEKKLLQAAGYIGGKIMEMNK